MNPSPHVQALFQQARQAYSAGHYQQALAACDRLISLGGKREEFLNLKAMSLLGEGRAVEAASLIDRALKKNPRSTGMLLNSARIELVLANRRNAKRRALDAVRLASNDPRVLYQAALACRQCGDYEQALRLIERCQQRAPDLAEAQHLEGSMRLDQGDREGAARAFEAALRIAPDNARALSDLARIRDDLAEDDPLVQQLQHVAAHGRSDWDRSAALFALADWRHRAGDHEQAADAYRQANTAGARVRPFNLAAWERKQEATLARHAELAPAGEPGQGAGARLVFLVGMPRSGTSLCEQVLGAAPGALACGELTAMHAIELHSAPGESKEDMRRRYLAHLPPDHGGARLVTDKLPMNFERVGLIHELFPGARFLYCRRHPLDTILSCYQQDFQAGVKWAFDLDSITRVYLAHERLMRHWSERLPSHVHTVDYERMVNDLPGAVSDIAAFLDIDVHGDMMQPHRSARTVQTASRLQVRESVYTTSVARWRRYETLLSDVAERLRREGLLDD